MSRFKKPVAYLFFAFVATFFFLHTSFPALIVRNYLEELVEQRFSNLSLQIGHVAPSLPVGIRLEKSRLIKKMNPSLFLFEADSFVIMPSVRMLVTGRPALGFACRAYGGQIDGVTTFQKLNFGPPLRTEVDLLDVKLERYSLLKKRLNRECSGIVSGTMFYELPGADPIQGAGQGDITISDGSIRFVEPFLGLQSFDFKKIEAHVELKDQKLFVSSASFGGPQITGEGTGTISLNRTLSRSGLNFTVVIRPVSDFLNNNRELLDAARVFLKRLEEGQFTVKIRGTIAQPRASFM